MNYFRLNITSKGITKLSVDVVKITPKNLVVKRESYSNRHVPIEHLNKVFNQNRFMDFTPDLVCWCDETHVDECIKLLTDALAKWIDKSNSQLDALRDKVNAYKLLLTNTTITERRYDD